MQEKEQMISPQFPNHKFELNGDMNNKFFTPDSLNNAVNFFDFGLFDNIEKLESFNYLAKMIKLRDSLEKSKQEKIAAAIKEIEIEYYCKLNFYRENIERLEAIIFLEKCGYEIKKSPKQESSEASQNSSERDTLLP